MSPPPALEPDMPTAQRLVVVANGLARGADSRLVKRAARLLQGYEKLYWDTLHALWGA